MPHTVTLASSAMSGSRWCVQHKHAACMHGNVRHEARSTAKSRRKLNAPHNTPPAAIGRCLPWTSAARASQQLPPTTVLPQERGPQSVGYWHAGCCSSPQYAARTCSLPCQPTRHAGLHVEHPAESSRLVASPHAEQTTSCGFDRTAHVAGRTTAYVVKNKRESTTTAATAATHNSHSHSHSHSHIYTHHNVSRTCGCSHIWACPPPTGNARRRSTDSTTGKHMRKMRPNARMRRGRPQLSSTGPTLDLAPGPSPRSEIICIISRWWGFRNSPNTHLGSGNQPAAHAQTGEAGGVNDNDHKTHVHHGGKRV